MLQSFDFWYFSNTLGDSNVIQLGKVPKNNTSLIGLSQSSKNSLEVSLKRLAMYLVHRIAAALQTAHFYLITAPATSGQPWD